MEQYVPDVTEDDVERILMRDYPTNSHDTIHELIRRVGVREKPRVVLACLKNARGDLQKLEGELTQAEGYYREILGEAEYPNYTKKMFRIEKLTADEQRRIIEKDKAQYLEWLHGKAGPDKPNQP